MEKPPAIDLETMRRLRELERANPNVSTFVGYNFEQASQYAVGMSLICKHTSASLMSLLFVSSSPSDRGCYHDVLTRVVWDTLIHPVNMVIRAFGPPVDIMAKLIPLAGATFSIHVHMEHSEGRYSFIDVGTYSPKFDFQIRFESLGSQV